MGPEKFSLGVGIQYPGGCCYTSSPVQYCRYQHDAKIAEISSIEGRVSSILRTIRTGPTHRILPREKIAKLQQMFRERRQPETLAGVCGLRTREASEGVRTAQATFKTSPEENSPNRAPIRPTMTATSSSDCLQAIVVITTRSDTMQPAQQQEPDREQRQTQ